MSDGDEVELRELIRLGRKYKWSTGDTRARLEAAGVNLTRSDFYSEAPTLEEIESSFEYAGGAGVGDTAAVFDDPVVFDSERIRSYAERLIPVAAGFEAPLTESEGFYWRNSQFTGTDAVALYAIAKMQKPKQIVEIGSGFSTFLIHRAMQEIGSGAITCVDPNPRADISQLRGIDFRRVPVQNANLQSLLGSLQSGDIVFYDESHSIKSGSDAVFFYLNPSLSSSGRLGARPRRQVALSKK